MVFFWKKNGGKKVPYGVGVRGQMVKDHTREMRIDQVIYPGSVLVAVFSGVKEGHLYHNSFNKILLLDDSFP